MAHRPIFMGSTTPYATLEDSPLVSLNQRSLSLNNANQGGESEGYSTGGHYTERIGELMTYCILGGLKRDPTFVL